jgi:hypothetical protein
MTNVQLPDGMEYLTATPQRPIEGRMIVHNFPPRPNQQLSDDGFRAYTYPEDANVNVTACDCGWAPGAGVHYVRIPQSMSELPVYQLTLRMNEAGWLGWVVCREDNPGECEHCGEDAGPGAIIAYNPMIYRTGDTGPVPQTVAEAEERDWAWEILCARCYAVSVSEGPEHTDEPRPHTRYRRQRLQPRSGN